MTAATTRRLVSCVLLVAGLGAAPPVAPAPRPAPPERVLERGCGFATSGRIDLFVAATTVWQLPSDDDRLWQPTFDLTDKLTAKAEFRNWPPESNRKGFRSLAGFRRAFNPQFVRVDHVHQLKVNGLPGDVQQFSPGGIMASGVTVAKSLVYNLIISRNDVRVDGGVCISALLVNGDLVIGNELSEVIVVCDGNISVADNVTQALVIARGSITAKGSVSGSTLVAGGSVHAEKRIVRPKELIPVVTENEPNPFRFVTFFELSRVGLEVKAADGAVRVSAVTAKGASEKAGVRVGDVVLDVGGKKSQPTRSRYAGFCAMRWPLAMPPSR